MARIVYSATPSSCNYALPFDKSHARAQPLAKAAIVAATTYDGLAAGLASWLWGLKACLPGPRKYVN